MKQLLLLFVLLCTTAAVQAQNVGIGTTTPNASAQLDVASTTRGFLLPRMTQVQRINVPNPVNGLLVYDTTFSRLYQFQEGTWKYFLNSTFWGQSTSRNWIFNSLDSIGIGTSAPTQRLDVTGNIRSRNTIIADDNLQAGGNIQAGANITATGSVSGAGLQTSGNLTVGGNATATGIVSAGGLNTSGALTVTSNAVVGGNFTASGNLSTNNDLIINNTGATLQLRNGSNVNKGFFQLSGEDLRLGTNSGNNLGSVIMRLNGANRFTFTEEGRITISADNTPTINFTSAGLNKALLQVQGEDLTINAPGNRVRISNVLYTDDGANRVGIGTISPTETLHVSGNTRITGNATVDGGKVFNNENVNMLPIAWAKYSFSGSKVSGTANITVTRKTTSTGVKYHALTVSNTNLTNACVIVTSSLQGFSSYAENYFGDYAIFIYGDAQGDWVHTGFTIVIYN